jgi:4-hydroxybenzoyl-CoA reductase subunit beta
VLRLHRYRYHRPRVLEEAIALLGEHGGALPIAGGTDLVPNMKHRLFTPDHLVALSGVEEMHGIAWLDAGMGAVEEADGAAWLSIGAAETLSAVARDERVRGHFPALARAASLVAGPQIRNRGTIGGNLCLDTRCTYYNQTEFWRGALGYCLKKDGDVCHVTRVGRKCVAAHSADTPPVFATLGAEIDLAGPGGTRTVPVDSYFVADGIWNTVREPGELVVRVRVPTRARTLRTAYAKLRQRRAIDFPLLSVALAADVGDDGGIASMALVVSALGARPRAVSGLDRVAVGRSLAEAADDVAALAHKQCHPLENIIVEPSWRRAMVPVFVRRALREIGA